MEPSLLIGKAVSHYRVLKTIGGGGMGMVFEAEDVKLGRRVALKFLPVELSRDPVALKHFEREAQTTSALNHPNICTIYEIEEHEGQPFIAMEMLEGETLHRCMTASESMVIPLQPLVDIAIQVCEGLQAAHGKGIVHRDIKPANLFVTTQGVVKILDFGIAKPIASEDIDWAEPSGTTGYMSPEQVRKEKLDARTDLFSFGLVLYQMACGRRAFTGDTIAALQNAILNENPIPPGDLNSAVPHPLDAVITKALEKDRTRRYQSADALRVDLKQLYPNAVSDHTAVAAVASAAKQRKFPRWAGITGAALIVVAILALQLVRSEGKTVNAIAVLPFVNATNVTANEYLSDGITEDLINALSELPNMKVVARSTVFRFKGKDEDPAKIGQELRVDAVLTGRVSERNGELNIQTDLIRIADGSEMWGAQYSRSKPNLMTLRGEIVSDVSARLRSKVSGEQRQEMTKPPTLNSEAYDLYLKGRYAWNQRGKDNVVASLADFQQAIVADPNFALAYSGLADAYSVAPPYGVSTPKEAHPLALAAAAKALQLEPNLAEAHAAMGAALAHTRQWEAAEKEFKRSLELNPNNASAHYLYGFEMLTPMKRFDEAAPQYRAALEIDPLSPIINGNYGVFLFMQHKYDLSMQQLKKTLELQPGFTVSSLRMGDLLALKGDFTNAIVQRHAYFPNMIIPEHPDAQSYGRATVDAVGKLGGYQPYYLTAEAWVWIGDKNEAFEYLKKGCEEEDNLEPVFLRSPSFDPIRSDPRYLQVSRCLRIPE